MKFYRYTWKEYSKSMFPDPKLELQTLHLVKETPQGYWIAPEGYLAYKSFHKWVSKTSRKRFAYPTKEEARHSFILRTRKRVKILERQVSCCKIALSFIEGEIKKGTEVPNS